MGRWTRSWWAERLPLIEKYVKGYTITFEGNIWKGGLSFADNVNLYSVKAPTLYVDFTQLNDKWNYITRNDSGVIRLWTDRPVYKEDHKWGYWSWRRGQECVLDPSILPSLVEGEEPCSEAIYCR